MHIHLPGVIAASARRSERGAGLIEYALLLALIAFVCIGAITYFGNTSGNSVNHSTDCIVAAGTPGSCP
ncbi:MAG: Flp/Fap pilin component [Acidimicrobiales bacterium]|nr:Flp/Fap pilin component [Acidimicrobiales bacterium]